MKPVGLLDDGERHRHLFPNGHDLPRIEKQQFFMLEDNVPVHTSIALFFPPRPWVGGLALLARHRRPAKLLWDPERTNDIRTTAHRT